MRPWGWQPRSGVQENEVGQIPMRNPVYIFTISRVTRSDDSSEVRYFLIKDMSVFLLEEKLKKSRIPGSPDKFDICVL